MPDPSSEAPVLDLLAAMTAESVARCDLDANSLIAARLAALAAVDAPTASYLLIAVAPIIGTARTLSAAENITAALGITIVALEEALDAQQPGQ